MSVRKVVEVLEDDINGGPADETVYFGLDNKTYEIDLNAENAQRLRNAVAEFVGHARPVSAAGRSRRKASTGGPSPADVRAWARSQGMEVNERGRVSAELIAAYEAAR